MKKSKYVAREMQISQKKLLFIFTMQILLLLQLFGEIEKTVPFSKVELLLVNSHAHDLTLDLSKNFAIGNDSRILIQSGSNIFDLNNNDYLLNCNDKIIDDFEFTDDGTLHVIANKKLGYFYNGCVQEIIQLPSLEMSITKGGNDHLYIYGGDSKTNTELYLLKKNKGYIKLVSMPKKIISVTATNEIVFISTGSEIFKLKLENTLELAFEIQNASIQSLAYDKNNDILFFSNNNSIFAFKNNAIELLARDVGEYLSFHNDFLYIYNPEKGSLLKITLNRKFFQNIFQKN